MKLVLDQARDWHLQDPRSHLYSHGWPIVGFTRPTASMLQQTYIWNISEQYYDLIVLVHGLEQVLHFGKSINI